MDGLPPECLAEDIACEVGRLVEVIAGTGGFTWYEIVSGIVVPVLLGLGTIILAVFTLGTDRRGQQLTREIEEQRIRREELIARRRTVPLWQEWAFHALVDSTRRPGDPEMPTLAQTRKDLDVAIQQLGDGTARSLRLWISKHVDKWRQSSTDEPLGLAANQIIDQVEAWAEDPTSIEKTLMQEARRSALERAIANIEQEQGRGPVDTDGASQD